MAKKLNIHFDVSFGVHTLRLLSVAGILFAGVSELSSESVTVSTYYPAPSGVYTRMVTTGDTVLSRDPGGRLAVGTNVALAGATKMAVMGGNVGIGTTNPTAALEVAGRLMITGGAPAVGSVLTSDAVGLASWVAASTGPLRGIGCTWRNTSPIQFGSAVCPLGQYMDGVNVVFYDPDRSPTDFRLQIYCCNP